jgi:hypothetical protein
MGLLAPNSNNLKTMADDLFGDDDDAFASFDMDAVISSQSTPGSSCKTSLNSPASQLPQQKYGNAASNTPVPTSSQDVEASIFSPNTSKVIEGGVGQSYGNGPSDTDLQRTLSSNFGFDEFRPGQLGVIKAALKGQDTAIYWATGNPIVSVWWKCRKMSLDKWIFILA